MQTVSPVILAGVTNPRKLFSTWFGEPLLMDVQMPAALRSERGGRNGRRSALPAEAMRALSCTSFPAAAPALFCIAAHALALNPKVTVAVESVSALDVQLARRQVLTSPLEDLRPALSAQLSV
ncbi:hypothetical protein ACTJNA_02015 [Klebsiella pneumoniae]